MSIDLRRYDIVITPSTVWSARPSNGPYLIALPHIACPFRSSLLLRLFPFHPRYAIANAISRSLYRKSYIYKRLYPIAPPRYDIVDLSSTVGSVLARSNGPHMFPATVIAPALFFIKSPAFSVFCLIRGKKAIFAYFSVRHLCTLHQQRDQLAYFSHFLSPQPKLAPKNELGLSIVTSPQILRHFVVFPSFL